MKRITMYSLLHLSYLLSLQIWESFDEKDEHVFLFLMYKYSTNKSFERLFISIKFDK